MSIDRSDLDIRVVEYLYGDLDERATFNLRAEIDADPELTAQLKAFGEVQSLTSLIPEEEPDPKVSRAVMDAAREELADSQPGFWEWLQRLSMAPALAGIFLLVAGGGLFLELTGQFEESAVKQSEGNTTVQKQPTAPPKEKGVTAPAVVPAPQGTRQVTDDNEPSRALEKAEKSASARRASEGGRLLKTVLGDLESEQALDVEGMRGEMQIGSKGSKESQSAKEVSSEVTSQRSRRSPRPRAAKVSTPPKLKRARAKPATRKSVGVSKGRRMARKKKLAKRKEASLYDFEDQMVDAPGSADQAGTVGDAIGPRRGSDNGLNQANQGRAALLHGSSGLSDSSGSMNAGGRVRPQPVSSRRASTKSAVVQSPTPAAVEAEETAPAPSPPGERFAKPATPEPDPGKLLRLALSADASGQCSIAIRHYKTYLGTRPTKAKVQDVYLRIAGCYERLKNRPEAVKHYRMAARVPGPQAATARAALRRLNGMAPKTKSSSQETPSSPSSDR